MRETSCEACKALRKSSWSEAKNLSEDMPDINVGRCQVLVDPHAVYPPEFRAEKLDGTQVAFIQETGTISQSVDFAAAGSYAVTTSRF